ncbi:MAG: hypothetical protein ACRDSM_12955, partial [Pseudonocardiaceae bacterium]
AIPGRPRYPRRPDPPAQHTPPEAPPADRLSRLPSERAECLPGTVSVEEKKSRNLARARLTFAPRAWEVEQPFGCRQLRALSHGGNHGAAAGVNPARRFCPMAARRQAGQ